MPLMYPAFYRRHGVRLINQVAQPVISDLALLELPINSVYHYLTFDGVELGPASDDFLFRNITKPILVAPVLDLTETKGVPRKLGVNALTLVRDYHVKHRRTRQLKSLDGADRDKTTLLVYNYSLLGKTYKYVRSFYTDYYKWYNTFATAMSTVGEIAQVSDRQQFIMAKSPKIIPSLQQLNLASKELTQSLLKVFRGEESYLLLELWKWLGEDRQSSLFSLIPENKIHLVNIVFQESGKWCTVNLGVLNSFRAATDDKAVHAFVIEPNQVMQPIQLQKRLLRMMMTIMELRTLTANVAEEPVAAIIAPSSMLQKLNEDDDESTTDEIVSFSGDTQSTGGEVAVDAVPEALPYESDAQYDESEDEVKARLAKEDEQLDEDLAQLNDIARRQEETQNENEDSLSEVIFDNKESDLEAGVIEVCDRLADEGLLSAGEYRKFLKSASAYKTIVSPDGQSTLDEYIQIAPETLIINGSSSVTDSASTLDKSMLKSSLLDFDSRYITNVLGKDIAAMVLNVQKAGVAVTGYNVEKVTDVLGGYEMHTLRLAPVVGQQSTLRFKLPIVNPDGTYTANSVKYRLRKQRGDLPIRKVGPARVALTSYYGKTFINRGKKKANDYGYWLQCQMMAMALSKENNTVSELVTDNVFDPRLAAPRSYSAMAMVAKSFMCRGYHLLFDHKLMLATYPPATVKALEKGGNLVIGFNASESFLVMDKNGTIYTTQGNALTPFGSLEQFLNLPMQQAPIESAGVVVFGKEIPIGVLLGYNLGFEKLLRLLKVEPRRVAAGARLNLASHEYSLSFSDETLVFSREDRFASMVLAGFNEYHRTLKLFSVYSFDKRGVYLNLLEANGLGVRYVREVDLMYKMFIDPITKDLLIEMKEPTTFQGLLLRACEMLMEDKTPDELDPSYMRIKGYERLGGAVYTELIQALRAHGGRLGRSNAPIEMNPYAVWKRISEDPAKSQISEINPIQALKEMEAVTFGGTGGRNSRSMTKITRAFHPNDMGTISESTVDASDVGINIFTSADPQFTSLRGMSKRFVVGTTGAAALLSTSALLAPGSDQDDPKRVNFVAIQQGHSIACDGYRQATVRTGYDQVVAHRSYDLFAFTAKQPGAVKAINAKGIVIVSEDGTEQGYELGRRFGNAAGLTIPHNVVSPLAVGDVLKVGDVICYNTGFFEPNFFNPKEIVLKNSTNVKTVLWESTQTLEDASSISKRVSGLLTTKITKVKTVVVNFDQTINRLLKVGEVVNADTILCIIEDAVTANNNLFDDQSLDTLRSVSAQTPRSHVNGVVEKIEVFYYGDKDDMSETLRAIANAGDRDLKRVAESMGVKGYTGSVDGGFRIDNNQLGMDSLAIRIYITSSVTAGSGDKGVFCNQMKTVFSEVLESDLVTENGEVIDAVFGQKSIDARIVSSPALIGTTNTLLSLLAKRAVKLYKGQTT